MEGLHGFEDVFLVHWADVDRGHWDLHRLKELKKRLKRADGRSLHAYTMSRLFDILLHDVDEVVCNLNLVALDVFLILGLVELGASKRVVEVSGTDLDAHRALDRFMVDVVCLHTHLTHRLRSQERSDCRHDRAVETGKHDGISHVKAAIDQNYVDCSAKTFDDLNLKDRAFELLFLLELVLVASLA